MTEKPTKTAFELETLIVSELLNVGECPIGVIVKVAPASGGGWNATCNGDAKCKVRVEQAARRIRAQFDIEG